MYPTVYTCIHGTVGREITKYTIIQCIYTVLANSTDVPLMLCVKLAVCMPCSCFGLAMPKPHTTTQSRATQIYVA